MINTNSDNTTGEIVLPTDAKKPRGRPRVEWRHNADGTYNKQPISKSYYNDYYRERISIIKVECPYCKHSVVKPSLPRHFRENQKCFKIRSLLT